MNRPIKLTESQARVLRLLAQEGAYASYYVPMSGRSPSWDLRVTGVPPKSETVAVKALLKHGLLTEEHRGASSWSRDFRAVINDAGRQWLADNPEEAPKEPVVWWQVSNGGTVPVQVIAETAMTLTIRRGNGGESRVRKQDGYFPTKQEAQDFVVGQCVYARGASLARAVTSLRSLQREEKRYNETLAKMLADGWENPDGLAVEIPITQTINVPQEGE